MGKSCIIQQYVFKKFSDKYKSTIGADFFSHDVVIDDVPYTLQVGIEGDPLSDSDLGYRRTGTFPESGFFLLPRYGRMPSGVRPHECSRRRVPVE